MPKTVQEGSARRSESMQHSSATPKNQDVGRWSMILIASCCVSLEVKSHNYHYANYVSLSLCKLCDVNFY